MNKTLQNYWLDMALFLTLGLDVFAAIGLPDGQTLGHQLSLAWHIHAISSVLLAVGCLVHILLHLRWFQAVLAGKAKGRIKLVMNSMVTIMLLLAGISGHAAIDSAAASRFHSLTGSFALIGLSIHAIKHTPWMAAVTRRLVSGSRVGSTSQSA